MISQALAAAHGLAAPSGDTLDSVCGQSGPPGIACRLTWDLLHNKTAAQLVDVWLARPVTLILQILFVVLVAIVIRLLALRLIRKITRHAAESDSALFGRTVVTIDYSDYKLEIKSGK